MLLFNEQSARLGIEAATAPWVAFGVKWLDYDNDGWLDLVIANGYVQDNINQIDKESTYRQSSQLLHSEGGTRFSKVTELTGSDFKKQIVGRGLATGDFDNDGRIDVLIVNSEGEPLLMHNQSGSNPGTARSGAGFRLAGPHAEGAQVTVEAGNRKLMRLCTTGGSYMSASDPRVHVGLGDAKSISRVTVRWADGKSQAWDSVPVGRYTTLTRK